jgi:transcriptional regulator with XRE-family HTH domain
MGAEEFGEVLKELRAKAGLSQKALAEALDVDQATVSRWERGEREPWLSIVGPLARVLGVEVETLVNPPAPPARSRKPKPRGTGGK